MDSNVISSGISRVKNRLEIELSTQQKDTLVRLPDHITGILSRRFANHSLLKQQIPSII